MTTNNINYSSNTAIAFDLSSLASSGTFVGGRESSEIDNTTNKYIDCLVNVKGITGHASIAPSVGQQINLFVWGSDTSLATQPIDTLDGTDSAETLSHVSILDSLKRARTASVTVATAGLAYYMQPFSVASLFGGIMPKYWGLFASHNHTGALGSSNSGLFYYTGIKFDSA